MNNGTQQGDVGTLTAAIQIGTQAALTHLREQEVTILNQAMIEPDALHTQLVALGGLHREEARAFLRMVSLYLCLTMSGESPDLEAIEPLGGSTSTEG